MTTILRRCATILACCLVFALPARAASSPSDLKADIDNLMQRIQGASHGILKWDGAEKIDVHQDGAASVADIVNARILIGRPPAPAAGPAAPPPAAHPEPVAQILFDHIAVRRTPAADNGFDIDVTLPKTADVSATDKSAAEATLTFDNATIHAVVDAQSERARELTAGFSSARIDDKTTGGWITFGPLSSSYKLSAAADGSWTAPGKSELKKIAFFFPRGPVGGTIDRISFSGQGAGPDLAAANRLRDQISAMQQQNLPPAERSRAFLRLLPDFLSAYSQSTGTFAVDGMTVRKSDAEPLFSLKKASLDVSLNGLSGDTASLRITLKDDDLNVASTVPNAARIPHRGVVDFGVENVSTAALRNMIAAAIKAGNAATPPEQQAARQQMTAAVASLAPVFRVYDLAFDVQDAGVEANGKAEGSPLSPKGYSADADIAVRNFDALHDLVSGLPLAAYMPLLKEIGTTAQAGGVPETKFHLASAPGKWITLNGDDVSGWFAPRPPAQALPRTLRPAVPPLTGDDVRAVQQALADAKIEAPQSGVYDGATAAAVAHFQKANNLNVNGVVDAATRRKLGITADMGSTKAPN